MTNEEKQEALESVKYIEHFLTGLAGRGAISISELAIHLGRCTDIKTALNNPPVCVGGELLPCPFCGGTDIAFEDAGYNGIGHTRCANCFASGPEEMNPDGHAKAAKAWNTRALTAQQPVWGDALDIFNQGIKLIDPDEMYWTDGELNLLRKVLTATPAIDWEGMKRKEYGNIAKKSINHTRGWNAAIDHIRAIVGGSNAYM